MSCSVSLNHFKEIWFLQMLTKNNLSEFNGSWYVEMDDAFNLYLGLYVFTREDDGFDTHVGILVSSAITKELLHL